VDASGNRAAFHDAVLAVTTLSGPASSVGGNNILYVKAAEGLAGPTVSNGGLRVTETDIRVWDGSSVSYQMQITGGNIIYEKTAYASIRSNLATTAGNLPFSGQYLIMGTNSNGDQFSHTITANTMEFVTVPPLNALVYAIKVLQSGIYEVDVRGVATFTSTRIRLHRNGNIVQESATAGTTLLNCTIHAITELQADDLLTLESPGGLIIKEGFSFTVKRMPGANQVYDNGNLLSFV
jgi:hypothetical protein